MFFLMIRTAHLIQTPLQNRILTVRFTIVVINRFILRSAGNRVKQAPLHNLAGVVGIRYSAVEVLKTSRFAVKRITAQLTLILLVFTLVIPGFTFAQQTQTSSGINPGGTNPRTGNPGRRGTRASTAATTAIERDFDEALQLIEDQYVDGRKLNYNDVFKS